MLLLVAKFHLVMEFVFFLVFVVGVIDQHVITLQTDGFIRCTGGMQQSATIASTTTGQL